MGNLWLFFIFAVKCEPGPSQETKPPVAQNEDSNDGKPPVKKSRPVPTNNDLPGWFLILFSPPKMMRFIAKCLLAGMIGSLEEYAQIVGKSVNQLADAKYEPPEVSRFLRRTFTFF